MIYFIQCGGNDGPIKIGYSNNVDGRVEVLQVGCPYELKLLWKIQGTGEKEAEIQERFKDDKIRGEWFKASKNLLAFIDEDADNRWEIVVEEDSVNIQETRKEINISHGGWHLTETKDEQEIYITIDNYYKVGLDLGHNGDEFKIRLHDGGVSISSMAEGHFGGVDIHLVGKKTVVSDGEK